MATPVISVTGHEGTTAVTADLLGLLCDHGATLRSVAPGSDAVTRSLTVSPQEQRR